MATNMSFWELWLHMMGMAPLDAISMDRRDGSIRYARTLEKEINDYYLGLDKNRSKERLAYLRGTLDNYATRANVYTDLEKIRSANSRAEIAARVDELTNYRDSVTQLSTRGSSFAEESGKRARDARLKHGGSSRAGLSEGLDAWHSPDEESVDGQMNRLNAASHLDKIIDNAGLSGQIEWDDRSAQYVPTIGLDGRESLLGQEILGRGSREAGSEWVGSATLTKLNHFGALSAGQQQTRDTAIRQYDAATNRLGGIKGIGPELDKATADMRVAFNALNKAYDFVDPAIARNWEADFQQESKRIQGQEATLEKLHKDIFTVDEKLERRLAKFGDPNFLKWAQEKGHTRLGEVVEEDGKLRYIQGAHDDQAMIEFNLEEAAGVTKQGRPRYASVYGGIPRAIAVIKYTALVKPEEVELLRDTNGEFIIQVAESPVGGEATRRYLSPKVYAQQVAEDAPAESPWRVEPIDAQPYQFLYNETTKKLYLQSTDSMESEEVLLNEQEDVYDVPLLNGVKIPRDDFETDTWETLPVEARIERSKEPPKGVDTYTAYAKQYPSHARLLGDMIVTDDSGAGLRAVSPDDVLSVEVIQTRADSPGRANKMDELWTNLYTLSHIEAVKAGSRIKSKVKDIATEALAKAAFSPPGEVAEIEKKAAQKEARVRERGGGMRRLLTTIAQAAAKPGEEVEIEETDTETPPAEGTEESLHPDEFLEEGPTIVEPEERDALTEEEEALFAEEAASDVEEEGEPLEESWVAPAGPWKSWSLEDQIAGAQAAWATGISPTTGRSLSKKDLRGLKRHLKEIGEFEPRFEGPVALLKQAAKERRGEPPVDEETVEKTVEETVEEPPPTPPPPVDEAVVDERETVVEVPPSSVGQRSLERRLADPSFAELYSRRMAEIEKPDPTEAALSNADEGDPEPSDSVTGLGGEPVDLSTIESPPTPSVAELAHAAAGVEPFPEGEPVTTPYEVEKGQPGSLFERWTNRAPLISKLRRQPPPTEEEIKSAIDKTVSTNRTADAE